MILSFIVPAYNAEKTLSYCLDSLLRQDLQDSDYEIIVVNDGSTDNTAKIIDEYKSNYLNIRAIEQNNQGLSMARNNGCKLSDGKYIWFVDSDDRICPYCLSALIATCEENDCDLFGIAPSIPFRSKFPEDYELKKEPMPVYCGREWLIQPQCFIGAWAYIIKKDFWTKNNLQFYPGIYYEDVECMPRAFYQASRICALSSFSVYDYVQHPGTIINSKFTFKKAEDRITIIRSLRAFSSGLKDESVRLRFEHYCTDLFISCISDLAKSNLNISESKAFIHSIPKKNYPTYLYAESLKSKLYQRFVAQFPIITFYLKRLLLK